MKNTQKFIENALKIHGGKYNYSKVEYNGCYQKICIICPEHGEFFQQAHSHLNGRGCPICGKYKKTYKNTKQYFIKKAEKKHGNKYDYSKVEYINSHTKICIICPEHGEFWQTPREHLNMKNPCRKCVKHEKIKKIKYTRNDFIKKAIQVHGNKYDYSKVNYIDSKTKVCIICPEHGEFWQLPNSHLIGRGCNKCSKNIYDKDSFIKKAIQVHGNKYDYSKVNYIDSKTKVCIICPEHGEFWQLPSNHVAGKGCSFCKKEENNEKQKYTTETFVQKAIQIHNTLYDYSKVKYKNSKSKICIICPKHGEFWQTPHHHLRGEKCPICNISNLELEVKNLLDSMKFKYKKEFSPKWAKQMRYDFCIEKQKILIECQGEQHYFPVNFNGVNKNIAEENFIKQQKRDVFKYNKAIENNYKIIYYTKEKLKTNNEFTNIEDLKNYLINIIENE